MKAKRSDHGQRRFKAYRAPRATLCLNLPFPMSGKPTGTGRAYNFQNEALGRILRLRRETHLPRAQASPLLQVVNWARGDSHRHNNCYNYWK